MSTIGTGATRSGYQSFQGRDEIQEYRRGLNWISNHTSAVESNILRPVDCAFKFGGSSLADAERIDHVAHLIKDQIQEGYRPTHGQVIATKDWSLESSSQITFFSLLLLGDCHYLQA
jgi:hypothetical protein